MTHEYVLVSTYTYVHEQYTWPDLMLKCITAIRQCLITTGRSRSSQPIRCLEKTQLVLILLLGAFKNRA